MSNMDQMLQSEADYASGSDAGHLSELDELEEFVEKIVKMYAATSYWTARVLEAEFADYIADRRAKIKNSAWGA